MQLQIIPLVIIGLVDIALGLLVLARNPKSIANGYFAAFTSSGGLWAIGLALFMSADSDQIALIWGKIFYVAAILIAYFLVLFVLNFPNRSKYSLFRALLLALPVTLLSMAILIVPDFLTQGIVERSWGKEIILERKAYLLYSLYFLVYFFGALLIALSRQRNASGTKRLQLRYVVMGILIAGIFGVTFNLLLPGLGNYRLVWLGPLFSIVFVGLIAYTIVRHRLFDIRLVIARSLAYAGTTLTIGLIYGFGLFGFIDGFFPTTQTTTLQQAIYAFAAVFLAFTFQSLKRFFDKLTDRLFYRDRYDSETVLNALGKIYVSKINSFELLDDSLKVLMEALKVEFGHLLVLDKGKIYKQAYYGSHKESVLDAKALQDFNEQITIYDELEEDNLRRNKLQAIGAQVVVQLATQDGLIGYLVLGAKQSGVIYTQQDVNLLELVARELAVAIQNAKSYAQIQAFSETLKQEVREATAQLRVTNKRLRKLDTAKDEFISMASHQLRTPLTSIKGYVSMLQDGDAGNVPEEQRQYLDLAFVSAEKMNNLISDMLNVSRISTGKLTFDKAPVNLAKLVESEVDQLRAVAQARNVQINFQPPREPLSLLSLDGGKMRQVIMNFIDNAIYYTPGGHITVSLEQVDGNVEFKVKDNGIGVSREAQKQLFSKFFRAGNAQKVRPDGTGLGLYMAKQVVEAQGGQIIFSSVEGKGSTFGFRFRLEDN